MLDKIDRFEGNYRFLSNFFIEPDGTHVEGEYQAMKCRHVDDIMKFVGISPSEAKKLGRKVELRTDWNDKLKIEIMQKLVRQKFEDNFELAMRLVATGDAELIEGNWWGDKFWGQCEGVGDNWLGKILMEVREIAGKWKVWDRLNET